jgi:lipopolysaccharide/colanic/teichoic acid biosynthesis glycosyltransferase
MASHEYCQMISLSEQPSGPHRKFGGHIPRHAFDTVCAFAGLAILIPLFAIIALAIKLDDGGPVLYFQIRIGKGLRKFRLLKFRSMIPNCTGGEPADGAARRARHTRRPLSAEI